VLLETPPPVAVTVTVHVPSANDLETVSVRVLENVGVPEELLRLPLIPLGAETLRVTVVEVGEPLTSETVMTEEPLPPLAMTSEDGLAETVKSIT
jgi:hypothetical protein